MSNELSVPPERVVEILVREPLGAALWRAAANEAMVEVYQRRVEELERQKSSNSPAASVQASAPAPPSAKSPAAASPRSE